MRRRLLVMAALVLPLVAGSLEAQQRPGGIRNRPGALRPNRRLPQPDESAPAEQPARTQQLQQQVRRSLWRVAKLRIGFSDDQMLRLVRTSQRFDQQRRQLAQEERALRVTIRAEILADSSANQASISAALDRLLAIQQRRLDLMTDEQREFTAFMTPLQRARFMALQEQVRRRLQQLERNRIDSTATHALQLP